MNRISLKQNLLRGNQAIAERNRETLEGHRVFTLNLIGSPGAGKTTLLEETIRRFQNQLRVGVIEGDLATTLDAERIAACGAEAVQINTRGACHLDAGMISQVLTRFDLANLDLLIIENVGNLVCPAEFDLGESMRITLLSTAEGADKAYKYPEVFERTDAVILNKTDLLPYVPFDMQLFHRSMKEVNQSVPVFQVSALSGEGMEEWIRWLRGEWMKREKG